MQLNELIDTMKEDEDIKLDQLRAVAIDVVAGFYLRRQFDYGLISLTKLVDKLGTKQLWQFFDWMNSATEQDDLERCQELVDTLDTLAKKYGVPMKDQSEVQVTDPPASDDQEVPFDV
jgi:hypothetical protein